MKDSLTSPEHSSGSLNISVPEVAEMFRKVVQKAASQLDLSPAQLAEQAEIPKSTLSMILSDKNDRLPSLMNCLKLAYALHLDIADFFPLVNARTRYLGDLKGAFLHPKQISTPKLFEILQELQPWSSAQWCPYNIPDFCKTPEFLAIENRISLEAAQAQIGIYNQASYLNVPGVILLRASVLGSGPINRLAVSLYG